MNDCLITFRSVTPAQRGERVLRRAGVRCSLGRTPKWMEELGCGYSLRLGANYAAQSAALLRGEGVPFRKMYLLRENGKVEEMEL